ncbi:MAG TPA: hypothetical protein VMQ83_02200 [Gammaproteobacteria bacterium]|nr:hypothetical protein [Gammaproteobacteria bacterium]
MNSLTSSFQGRGLVMLAICLAGTSLAGEQSAYHSLPLDCEPAELAPPLNELCTIKRHQEGERLFTEETFGGNGRTCETCHSRKTGTFSPEDVQKLLVTDPDNPLFIHDGTDDGTSGIARILEHATVRITLPLPPNIKLKHDPAATEVTFLRGTPTTKNTPALDPVLMYDRRNNSLQEQALGAIDAHAQSDSATPLQLDLIAEFQRTDRRFFSSHELYRFATGGAPPVLPAGNTPSEKRGREFFIDAPFNPPSKAGVCGLCHSGPMLDTANIFSTPVFGNPPGVRDHNVLVSERNLLGLPQQTFLIYDTIDPGNPVEVTTPDLGMLITPNGRLLAERAIPPDFVIARQGLRRAFFANFFKTPTLWGVKDTAPYFHDNSAKTLAELVDHYEFFFQQLGLPIELTEQDKADMVAFMELL